MTIRSRTIVNFIKTPILKMPRVTLLPGFPLINFTASSIDMPFVMTPSIDTILSLESTPAFEAGVQPRDVIVSINDQSTRGMSIENAVKLIRGRKGTEVTLGLQRNNQLIKIQIIRDKIAIHAVDSKLNRTNDGRKIGYIRLKQFNANAVREMRKAIKGLEDQEIPVKLDGAKNYFLIYICVGPAARRVRLHLPPFLIDYIIYLFLYCNYC